MNLNGLKTYGGKALNGCFPKARSVPWKMLLTIAYLFFVTTANATINIVGPDTVCTGSSAGYTISPVSGLHYQWAVTSQGNIAGSGMDSMITVVWSGVGTATVTVKSYDSTNALRDSGSLAVTVMPLPTPFIVSTLMGCQNFADSGVIDPVPIPGHPYILNDSSGCIKVCENSYVLYTANGSAGDHFGWTVTGGTIVSLTATTCTVLWGSVGSGSIELTDTSAYGCVGVTSVCIEIIEKPQAHFYTLPDSASDITTACLDQPIVFVDNSVANPTSPIVSWYWDFGDGSVLTSSSSTSLTHAYHAPGSYTAMLVVRNQCGCTDTFRKEMEISDRTGVTIACPSVVCEKATATYTIDPPVNCSSYLWSVQGGTIISNMGPSVTVQWTNVDSTGFGYVSFDASNCSIPCPKTTVVKVPVVKEHGYIFGPKLVCANTQYLYQLPQWPTTVFTWSVITATTGATLWNTDQNNQIALNTGTAGTIILKCVYHNTLLGCGGVAYDTITVMPPVTIVGAPLQCLYATGIYSLSNGATASWTLTYPDHTTATGSGASFSGVFNQVGTYTLNATGNFCLSAPLIIHVNPKPPKPDSLLGPSVVCFGTPVQYVAKNAMPGTIFNWAIASGTLNFTSGNQTTAVFSGASPAYIKVWRETMDAAHCVSDTLIKAVSRPVVTLNIAGDDTVCTSTAHYYTAGYADGESYSWSLSDPLKGSVLLDGGATSRILFNTIPGSVYVIVKVYKCGVPYLDSFLVYINPVPTLSITLSPNPVCRDAPFTATLNNGNIGTITWNWGDGSANGSGVSANHAYHDLLATSFNHTVTCTVTNPFGCPGIVDTSASITVLPAPVANVTPVGPFTTCTTPSIPLTATLSSGFQPTSTLAWYRVGSSGSLASCSSPGFPCNPYTAAAYGNYFVVATGTNGCKDTSNIVAIDTCVIPDTCRLDKGAAISFVNAQVDCGQVVLHSTYSQSYPVPFSWGWVYPPQLHNPNTNNTSLHGTFSEAGLYSFTYRVGYYDNKEDSCYLTVDTSVLVPFVAGMGYTVSCGSGSGYSVTLYDHSNYYPGHEPYKYSWYINNVHKATTTVGNYPTTLAAGTYNFKLWVYYHPGTTDSCLALDGLTLPALPHASFSFARDTTCANQASVQFTNLSTPVGGFSSYWDFGDLSANTQTNPWRVYDFPSSGSIYHATLTITNAFGCSDDTTLVVPIHKEDLAGKLFGDSIACNGQTVQLFYQPNAFTDYPEQYYWMRDLDTMFMNTISSINIATSGSYWVIGTNHYGCHTGDMDHINVQIINPPPAIIWGDTSACLNDPYTLNGYAGNSSSITYTWLKNGSIVQAGSNYSYTDGATSAGTFVYVLVVSIPNPAGGFCSDTSAPFTVIVHNPPAAPVVSFNIPDCNTYTVDLSASGPTAGWYNWSNGMNGQNISVIGGGGPYRVWYTDTFGCVNHGDAYVPKDPRAYLWIFPNGCFGPWCSQTFPRTVVGPIEPFNYWEYTLNGGTILSGNNSPVSPLSINAAGSYNLMLDNGWCQATSDPMDITIDTHCAPCEKLQYSVEPFTGPCDDPYTHQPDTCCQWFLQIFFNNLVGVPIGINLSATDGSMAPGGAVLPPGSSSGTFQFLPSIAGFSGGSVMLTISYTDPVTGETVLCQQRVELPPCKGANKPSGYNKAGDNVDELATGSLLRLIPNPAQQSTRIDYSLSDIEGGVIEVYDMVGRKMAQHQLSNQRGSWQLSLERYSAGLYMVVLKNRGIVVEQSTLSVVH